MEISRARVCVHDAISPLLPRPTTKNKSEQRAATAALEKALDAQQAMLDEQRLQIASQRREIEQLELLLQSTSAQVSQLEETSDSRLQDGDVLLSERLDRLEQQLQEAPEDPMVAQQDFFPGSWRVPGTNSAMRPPSIADQRAAATASASRISLSASAGAAVVAVVSMAAESLRCGVGDQSRDETGRRRTWCSSSSGWTGRWRS